MAATITCARHVLLCVSIGHKLHWNLHFDTIAFEIPFSLQPILQLGVSGLSKMDLLSLSASIIAVASLATTLDKALRASLSSLKNAPGELLAISNEVRDLQLVLESVIPMISSEQAMGTF